MGGIIGPVVFVATWAGLGATRSGYDPTDDPISRLAEVGATTRPAMTIGFLTFGLGVAAYAVVLHPRLPRSAYAALVTSAASLAVALFPLGAPFGDDPHAVMAFVAYSSLVAQPLLAVAPLRDDGLDAVAGIALALAAVSGVALVMSVAVSSGQGGWQRVGLTAGDAWIVGTAVWLIRSPDRRQITTP
jgi:hypothetical membrane protein